MESVFGIWGKVKDISPDLLFFIVFLFFIFKFKDISDLLIRCGSLKIERLKSAKELLELAGYGQTSEMAMIKEMMHSHAIRLATGIISDKGRNLYCYLFSLHGSEKMLGIQRSVRFVGVENGGFHFDEKAFRKYKWEGITTFILITIVFVLLASYFKRSDGINFSWLFGLLAILDLGVAFYWCIVKIPEGKDIKNLKKLLEEANVADYEKFID